MTISDWVLIGTTLLLAAVAIWGDKIKQILYPPKIKVTFDEISPYCHKTFYRSLPVPNTEVDINEPVFFFRFKVENVGSAKIKNCEAKLDQIWVYDSAGKPNKLHGWNDITLVWAGGRPKVIDLDPYRKGFCNIGHVASKAYQEKVESRFLIDVPGRHDQSLRFLFEQAEFPHSQPNCLVPGKYAIKVILYCENLPPKELWFQIAWSGKWQDTETEMFRELAINQITSLEPSLKRGL